MAVRDVSDKISPKEKVELQRWHCVTPIKAHLQVTARPGRVQCTSVGEVVVRGGSWVFWCHLPDACWCVHLWVGWRCVVKRQGDELDYAGVRCGGGLTQPERRTNEIWHYSVSTMSLIWAVIPQFQTGFMVINNPDKLLWGARKHSRCALHTATLYK